MPGVLKITGVSLCLVHSTNEITAKSDWFMKNITTFYSKQMQRVSLGSSSAFRNSLTETMLDIVVCLLLMVIALHLRINSAIKLFRYIMTMDCLTRHCYR